MATKNVGGAVVSWVIDDISLRLSDGFIVFVQWGCAMQKDEMFVSASGYTELADGNPKTAYKDVTEENVLAWVWESGVMKDEIEMQLTAALNAQSNPNYVHGKPWSGATG